MKTLLKAIYFTCDGAVTLICLSRLHVTEYLTFYFLGCAFINKGDKSRTLPFTDSSLSSVIFFIYLRQFPKKKRI